MPNSGRWLTNSTGMAICERHEGVGKRPPDLDAGLPLSEVIREVQRRAKLKMQT
jgi:hypothetical protein